MSNYKKEIVEKVKKGESLRFLVVEKLMFTSVVVTVGVYGLVRYVMEIILEVGVPSDLVTLLEFTVVTAGVLTQTKRVERGILEYNNGELKKYLEDKTFLKSLEDSYATDKAGFIREIFGSSSEGAEIMVEHGVSKNGGTYLAELKNKESEEHKKIKRQLPLLGQKL